jgi:hypothetical protein
VEEAEEAESGRGRRKTLGAGELLLLQGAAAAAAAAAAKELLERRSCAAGACAQEHTESRC